jgi:hypothetical protein
MGRLTGNVSWDGALDSGFSVPDMKPGTGFFSEAVISPVPMVCDDLGSRGTDTPFTAV